jgi:hypothetical protein
MLLNFEEELTSTFGSGYSLASILRFPIFIGIFTTEGTEAHESHFLRAWQIKGIRPHGGDPHPKRTDERYCLCDELSGSYGYTEA